MKIVKLLCVCIGLSIIYACSHPLEIVGEGDITSSDGRVCTLDNFNASADACTVNMVYGGKDYTDIYTATPRTGWQFHAWENCFPGIAVKAGNTCSFDVPAAVVRQAWGETMPPLRAVFTQIGSGLPITDFLTPGDGKEWAQPDLFTNLTWNEVKAACPARACTGKLNGFNTTGWTWATVAEVNGLFNSFGVNPPLVGPSSQSAEDSMWAPAFFAAGFRPTFVDFRDIVFALTASSQNASAAYWGVVEDETAEPGTDFAYTNSGPSKSAALSYVGAWFYRSP